MGIENGSLLYWWLKTAVPKMRGGITSARGGVVFGIVTLRGAVEIYGGGNDSVSFNRTGGSKDVLSGNFHLTIDMLGIEV